MSTVAKHIFHSYGCLFSVWISFFLKLVEYAISKVLRPILFAYIAVEVFNQNVEQSTLYVGYILISMCISFIVKGISDHIFVKATDAQYAKLATAFNQEILLKSTTEIQKIGMGKLSTIFRDHLDGTIRIVRLCREQILSYSTSLIFPVLSLFFFNYKIALALGVLVFIKIWITYKVGKYVKGLRTDAIKVYKKLSALFVEQIRNIELVKSANLEEFFNKKVSSLAKEEEELFTQRHKIEALAEFGKGILLLLGFCGVLLITIYGSESAMSGFLLILVLIYLIQINNAVDEHTQLPKSINEHITRVSETLPICKPLRKKRERKKEEIKEIQNITFSRIMYTYENEESEKKKSTVTYKGKNEIKKQEHYIITGESGIGKTSLCKILSCNLSSDENDILINGKKEKFSPASIRSRISYMPQEPMLFMMSIKENIKLLNPTASDQEMIKAAKDALIHEYIQSLPNGYETIIQEGGTSVSGGQKQRIALARTFLKDADIYLFDEPTSALDKNIKQQIATNMNKRLERKTALLISHDQIISSQFKRVIELTKENQNTIKVTQRKKK